MNKQIILTMNAETNNLELTTKGYENFVEVLGVLTYAASVVDRALTNQINIISNEISLDKPDPKEDNKGVAKS